MENIESVVRERNKAYWLLETDELGERPSTWSNNVLGKFFVRQSVLFFAKLMP